MVERDGSRVLLIHQKPNPPATYHVVQSRPHESVSNPTPPELGGHSDGHYQADSSLDYRSHVSQDTPSIFGDKEAVSRLSQEQEEFEPGVWSFREAHLL